MDFGPLVDTLLALVESALRHNCVPAVQEGAYRLFNSMARHLRRVQWSGRGSYRTLEAHLPALFAHSTPTELRLAATFLTAVGTVHLLGPHAGAQQLSEAMWSRLGPLFAALSTTDEPHLVATLRVAQGLIGNVRLVDHTKDILTALLYTLRPLLTYETKQNKNQIKTKHTKTKSNQIKSLCHTTPILPAVHPFSVVVNLDVLFVV